jgi:hypothetical protein
MINVYMQSTCLRTIYLYSHPGLADYAAQFGTVAPSELPVSCELKMLTVERDQDYSQVLQQMINYGGNSNGSDKYRPPF